MKRFLGSTAAIICAAAVLLAMTLGARQTFGLFLTPVEEELRLSREVFSFAIALQNILWGLLSPVFGGLADRFGAAKVAFAGAVLYMIGMLVMAAAGDGATIALGQGLIGTGTAGAGFSVALGAVGKAVSPERRSIALGVVTAAGSFGQFVMIPVAQELLSSFGWRGAVVGICAIIAIMLPASVFLRSNPGSLARNDDSQPVVAKAALSNRSYVLLVAGFFVCGFQIVFIGTHLPAFLADEGMKPWVAAYTLSLVGLFNVIGTLFFGWIGGKRSKKDSLSLLYLLRSIIITAFILMPITQTSSLVFGILIGLLWLGTVPLTSGLVAVFFGTRHMSLLYGIVFLSHQVGSAAGAWFSGFLYELTGDYSAAWWLAVGLGLMAAVLHYPIVESEDRRFLLRFEASRAA